MPKPRPLTPIEAKKTIAHRLSPKIDRLRQFATKFGLRPYRVFLVWTKFSASERGEGYETEVRRKEILPTPLVDTVDSVSLVPFAVGVVPVGTVRVSRVSVSQFTADELNGRASGEDHIEEPFSFFYEIVEDGRGDAQPARTKYRLSTQPMRRAGNLEWTFLLERMSEDRDRDGESKLGQDDD